METVIILIALLFGAQVIHGAIVLRRRSNFVLPDTRLEARPNPFVAAERARAVFPRGCERPPLA